MVGNIPNYTDMDILMVFLIIEKPVARLTLAREAGLGEGTARTILNILKNKKIISSSKNGHFLTENGRKLKDAINKDIISIKKITYEQLYPGKKKFAVHIRNSGANMPYMSLRDIAVKNNAEGALIFNFDKKLYIPDGKSAGNFSSLEKQFELKKNDLLVISFADDYNAAANGALAISSNLSKELKISLKKLVLH